MRTVYRWRKSFSLCFLVFCSPAVCLPLSFSPSLSLQLSPSTSPSLAPRTARHTVVAKPEASWPPAPVLVRESRSSSPQVQFVGLVLKSRVLEELRPRDRGSMKLKSGACSCGSVISSRRLMALAVSANIRDLQLCSTLDTRTVFFTWPPMRAGEPAPLFCLTGSFMPITATLHLHLHSF